MVLDSVGKYIQIIRSPFFITAKNIVLPNDATTLSFLLLKIVPISQKLVLEAMKLNSPIQRLRWIINILDSQVGV